jgi:pyridoxal biosynthesis lyase PdxS
MNQLSLLDRDPLLVIGAVAWTIVSSVCGTRSTSGARRTVEGAALVRIVGIDGERVTCEIVRASRGVLVGTKIETTRGELYSPTVRAEHAAFGALVRRLWGAS